MNVSNRPRRSKNLSVRIYRWLVTCCYPAAFRSEYGRAMVDLFEDMDGDARAAGGTTRMLYLWWRAVADTAVAAPREHWFEWRQRMRWKKVLPTMAGALFLLYGLSFAAVNILIYNLGFSNLWNPYSGLVDAARPTALTAALNALLILSPALAIGFLLLPSLRVDLDWRGERPVTVAIERGGRVNMILIGLSLGVGFVFALYVLGENLPCLLGQALSC